MQLYRRRKRILLDKEHKVDYTQSANKVTVFSSLSTSNCARRPILKTVTLFADSLRSEMADGLL